MAQSIPGVHRVVYKAVSGTAFDTDVEIDGNDITTDNEVLLETIATPTAKGGVRHQGNRSFDFTLNCFDLDAKAELAQHINIFGEVEFYDLNDQLVLTIQNVNPLVDDRVAFDTTDEAGAFFPIRHQGTNIL